MEKSVTVVSALYYIGRDKWKYSAFPPGVDRYKSWIPNLLSLDTQIYLFVDDFYHDYVVETRKQYDPEFKKTVIKKIPITELYFYKKYYVPEACLMFSPEFKSKVFFLDSADMNYPLYHIINFSKIDFVKRVAEENPFNSTHFFWSDAGGMREGREKYENTVWPKISKNYFNDKVIHFSHKEEYNIYPNKDEYFRSQDRNIQGTAWIVPKEKVSTFFDMIDNQVQTIINEKIVGSDEKVYDFLHNENKEFYQLAKCGWFEFYDLLNAEVEEELPPIIPTGVKVFVDMGAHEQQGLGQFKDILNIDSSWIVHCFEPNRLLNLDNRYTDLNVTMHNKAVWIHDKGINLNLYGLDRKSQGSIVVGSVGSEILIDLYDVIKTPCIDAYEFLNSFNEGDEVYIKMDIEWSEYDVLEYLLDKGWLRNIKKIWVEWHGTYLPEVQERKDKIIERLKNYNTEIENWY